MLGVRGFCSLMAVSVAMFGGGTACAQAVIAATAAQKFSPLVTQTFDQRGAGLWLRADTVVRQGAQPWSLDDRRITQRVTVQHELVDHVWLGVTVVQQPARYDMSQRVVREERHSAGAKLSFEPTDDVELGLAWFKRKRGMPRRFGPKPGPRAYVAYHF
jgi:hypothetical protein